MTPGLTKMLTPPLFSGNTLTELNYISRIPILCSVLDNTNRTLFLSSLVSLEMNLSDPQIQEFKLAMVG